MKASGLRTLMVMLFEAGLLLIIFQLEVLGLLEYASIGVITKGDLVAFFVILKFLQALKQKHLKLILVIAINCKSVCCNDHTVILNVIDMMHRTLY